MSPALVPQSWPLVLHTPDTSTLAHTPRSQAPRFPCTPGSHAPCSYAPQFPCIPTHTHPGSHTPQAPTHPGSHAPLLTCTPIHMHPRLLRILANKHPGPHASLLTCTLAPTHSGADVPLLTRTPAHTAPLAHIHLWGHMHPSSHPSRLAPQLTGILAHTHPGSHAPRLTRSLVPMHLSSHAPRLTRSLAPMHLGSHAPRAHTHPLLYPSSHAPLLTHPLSQAPRLTHAPGSCIPPLVHLWAALCQAVLAPIPKPFPGLLGSLPSPPKLLLELGLLRSNTQAGHSAQVSYWLLSSTPGAMRGCVVRASKLAPALVLRILGPRAQG
ncbi:uncharacterized protein SPEM3-like [Rhinopithecus roxellana]|uniref:uncharacterized protein SPEM3-like n=1 Tax=Rhinopithecus roxellana TaxID=61622 RepID=UPI0012372331|nr:uncharacterized protein SPEM3-like [Rhinopithecus roxellana]